MSQKKTFVMKVQAFFFKHVCKRLVRLAQETLKQRKMLSYLYHWHQFITRVEQIEDAESCLKTHIHIKEGRIVQVM